MEQKIYRLFQGLTYKILITRGALIPPRSLYILTPSVSAGMTWPVEGMHAALRSVIWMFPVQPAVEAYRGLVMRGWPVTHPVIYKGFLSTSVWTAIFIIATIAVTRRNKTSL